MGDAPAKPVLGEIATTRDGLVLPAEWAMSGSAPISRLPFSVPRVELERILRDDQVRATLQQRRLAVIARDWAVSPGGDRRIDRQAADAFSDELAQIGWDAVTDQMLWGVFYGYSVAEVIWRLDGRRVHIDAIKVRDRLSFRFDGDAIVYLTRGRRERMPQGKFWTVTWGADTSDDRYGRGLWYDLFWPVWVKREGLKSWLIGLDKTARPTVVGYYPPGTDSVDVARLLEALAAYASDTGIAIPEGMRIELLEARRTGTTDYDTLYQRMNEAISKIVLSQTMTTDSATTGLGSTQGEVHADVAKALIKADADLICETFSATVARWWTEWNFPGAAVPVVTRQVDDPEDLSAVSERDARLAQIGYVPTPERVREVYGEGYERQPPTAGPAPAEPTELTACPHCGGIDFAAGDPDIIDDLVQRVLDDEGWVAQLEPVLKPVASAAGDVTSLEAFRARLIELLSSMDTTTLQDILARSSFAARIAGATGADRDPPRRLAEPAELSAPDAKKTSESGPCRGICG